MQLQTIQKHLNPDYTKVSLPANLYIWATMNSADQSVKPLDTAFKRRWEFEYFDVNTNENEIMGRFWFTIGDDLINWNDFRRTINDFLSLDKFSVPEDKLMGVYFISKTTLDKLEDYPDELAQFDVPLRWCGQAPPQTFFCPQSSTHVCQIMPKLSAVWMWCFCFRTF